jgi:threonine synthase
MMKTDRLAARLGVSHLWVKDEGANPTGSFKDRGMSCAVSMCMELGLTKIAVASAGNAGSALAAYAAAAGIEAHIFVPRDVPRSNYTECRAYGAHVTLIDGLISDCGRIIAERKHAEGWFDVSGLKEPYRIEGKKTMGYEIAEQFGWSLPGAILYPTGGGVGLIGMWKAFAELEALGWISSQRPKMIAVQTTGCQPVVRAFERGESKTTYWDHAHTVAAGLRVPKPLGDALTLSAIRESGGTAIAVSDEELLDGSLEIANTTGIFAAPEGGACLAGLKKLLANGFLKPDERIVLYNTGTGLKYLEAFSTRFPQSNRSEHDKLGGLITPR